MRVTYDCGCSLSREEFGTPEYWPLPYFCPAHGAPRPMATVYEEEQSPPQQKSA